MTNVPASGWHATVTANGYTHTASVIEGQGLAPQQNPKSNSRPGIRLPVPKADKWQALLGDGSADVDLAVYHDGARQPIDTLVDVEQTDRATVLVGEGGRELKTRVELSFDQEAVHTAAENAIDNNTAYVSNVDTPPTTTETNTTLATWTTSSDFLTRISSGRVRQPIEVSSGSTDQLQTAFASEAESFDRSSGHVFNSDSNWSSGQGVVIASVGDFLEYDFTLAYDMPGEHFGLAIAWSDTAYASGGAGSTQDIEYVLKGDGIPDTEINPSFALATNQQTRWDELARSNSGTWPDLDLPAGDYTVRAECTSGTTGDAFVLDVVAPLDLRFYNDVDTFDADNGGSSGGFDDPANFGSVDVTFDTVPAPQAVTGGRLEATFNDNTGVSNPLHISNDQAVNFTSGGTTSGGADVNFETDSLGATFGPGITARVTLSGFGTQSGTTPETGVNARSLESLTVKADLEDMPLVVNRTFDGHLDAILAELAEIGDQLWEYARDGDTESIEWTTPGQRSATRTPNVNDFRATKAVGQVYQKAIVYGQPDVAIVGERFESDHGNAVSLANDRLQQGSERVSDPDTGERFRSGSDYTMDYQAGEITVLAAGDMADATVYEVDYRYQAYGEFDDGTASPNVTPRIDLPGLWSDFLCEQAARLIIDEVSTPIHTAEVTLPNDETGWSVVESLDPDIVPTGGNELHVRDVVNTPEATVLTLGSRRGLSDVVGDIRAQVGAVSRKA